MIYHLGYLLSICLVRKNFLYKAIKFLDIPSLKKNADFSRKIENFDADAFGGFSGKNIIM